MAVTITHLARATTGTSTSVTVPSGTELLLIIGAAEASATPLTNGSFAPTHSGSDTWTVIGQRLNRTAAPSGTTNAGIGLGYIVNPTAGTFTMGVTNTNGWGGSNGYLQFYAINGIDTSSPIGDIGYGSANNSTETVISFNEATGTVDASDSLTTTAANSMILAAIIANDLESYTLSGSGWTQDFNVAGTGVSMCVAYKTEASSGVAYGSTTWTASSATNRATTFQIELKAAPAGTTETVDVSTPGALTVAGQTVNPLETVPVTNGSMSIAGQAVAVNDTIAVTNGALTITGQTVNVTVQVLETVTVTDGALTIAGQTVTVTEIGTLTVTVDPGALTITGQDVTVTETAPPVIRNRAIGGGTGPSDPRFIKAEEARRAKERDLWRRIDDDLNGRQRAAPEAAPAPPQRETKPLPPASEQIHEILPDAIDLLMEAMNQDAVSTLMLRHDLPYYDPEEDAAVLLLLS